jgi:hypothetical protein
VGERDVEERRRKLQCFWRHFPPLRAVSTQRFLSSSAGQRLLYLAERAVASSVCLRNCVREKGYRQSPAKKAISLSLSLLLRFQANETRNH